MLWANIKIGIKLIFSICFIFTDLHNIPSTGYVSIQDFLQHGYNFSSLEM